MYLFQSKANRATALNKPITRGSVAKQFKKTGKELGLKLGTHSMRKTRGYMMYKAGVSIEQICRIMNQSSTRVTMAYIGLTKEETLQTYDDFVI